MTNIPYAAVTCLDTATSVGLNDASVQGIDYRFAGGANFAITFIGTLTSVGAADSVRLQVSPDYDMGSPAGVNATAMWQTVEVFTTTAFNGTLYGPWGGIRFIKPGDQAAKVVALIAGRNKKKTNKAGG